MTMEKKNGLTGKDLVTVGIYTALYFVVGMGAGFLGFFPIFIPLLTVIVPVLGGIPFMLFVSKVKKFGMISLLSAINGVCMFAAGMGHYVAGTGIVFGLLADFIIKSGEYKSAKKTLLGYCVFSLWLFGNYMPFYIGRDAQFAMLISGFGEEYARTLETFMPFALAPVMFVAPFVAGCIGGFLGKAVCKKHFERSGIL